MDWTEIAFILEDCAKNLAWAVDELTDWEDEAASALGVAGGTIDGIAVLMRDRADEYRRMEDEDRRRDEAEEMAAMVQSDEALFDENGYDEVDA